MPEELVEESSGAKMRHRSRVDEELGLDGARAPGSAPTARCSRWTRGRVLVVAVCVTALLALYSASRYRRHTIRWAGDGRAPELESLLDQDMAPHCEANGWTKRPAGSDVRVFDMFPFRNELDMLELRLRELSSVVDVFMLMEATVTQQGNPKELVYEQIKEDPRFLPFLDRIFHVVVDDGGRHYDDTHAREREHRNHLAKWLDKAGARPHDMVIFSDLDEIPRADYIHLFRSCEGFGWPISIHTPEYVYDFGCRLNGNSWIRTKVAERRLLKDTCSPTDLRAVCPDVLRDDQQLLRLGVLRHFPPPLLVTEGGWHLTWFMNIDGMLSKLDAYGHPERNTPENRDKRRLQCFVNHCMHLNGVDRGERISDPSDGDAVVVPFTIRKDREAGLTRWDSFFPRADDLPSDEVDCTPQQ